MVNYTHGRVGTISDDSCAIVIHNDGSVDCYAPGMMEKMTLEGEDKPITRESLAEFDDDTTHAASTVVNGATAFGMAVCFCCSLEWFPSVVMKIFETLGFAEEVPDQDRRH